MHNQTVNVGAQEISYLESEGTGRPVVFVHGNSSSARTWQPQLEGEFGTRFRCLALDLPGHGRSAPATDHATYSLPGYANVLTGFVSNVGAADAVFVGWSLGGHIALEASAGLPDAAGWAIFGTPPVSDAGQLGVAFLPNPAMNVGFTADVSRDQAEAYAASFTAPGSALPLDDFVADILATDGAARAGLLASVGAGRFADELAIVAGLAQPLAILHGAEEQLVSFDYLDEITVPTLWRGEIMIIDGAGHALHQEAPQQFTNLVEQFIADLDGQRNGRA
ncbi:MAG: alpha/beta fold hydrolase [Streptosporangiaceae bacterium]